MEIGPFDGLIELTITINHYIFMSNIFVKSRLDRTVAHLLYNRDICVFELLQSNHEVSEFLSSIPYICNYANQSIVSVQFQ